jgi:hypothetical protein
MVATDGSNVRKWHDLAVQTGANDGRFPPICDHWPLWPACPLRRHRPSRLKDLHGREPEDRTSVVVFPLGVNTTIKSRLTVLEGEKAQLERKLSTLKTAPVVRLHPNLPDLYRSKVENALNETETVAEAGDTLRSLIDRIVLTPVDGGLQAELHCDLAAIASLAQEREGASKNAGPEGDPALLSVVAGARYLLFRNRRPLTLPRRRPPRQ